jgi:hypothetical protein
MRTAAVIQGIFYLLTGLWPIVHLPTFLETTGPKTDIWLVKTVGVLVTVIALVLIMAGLRKKAGMEAFVLGVLSALALGAIDIIYVVEKVISPIYLWDAGVEALIVLMWILAVARRSEPL